MGGGESLYRDLRGKSGAKMVQAIDTHFQPET